MGFKIALKPDLTSIISYLRLTGNAFNSDHLNHSTKSAQRLCTIFPELGSLPGTIVYIPQGVNLSMKRPLCNYDGVIKELDYADSLPSGGLVSREIPSGTINGVNVSFTLAYTPITGSEMVFLDGVLQNYGYGNDYTMSGNTVLFAVAPITGSILLVTYWK